MDGQRRIGRVEKKLRELRRETLILFWTVWFAVVSAWEHSRSAVETLFRGRKRGVPLKFDLAIVRRLVDHARNAPESLPYYGGTRAEPALWLVGQNDVFLMSNGKPALGADGQLIADDTKGVLRLTAPAVGCDPAVDAVDSWRPIHDAIAGGDDFVQMLPVEDFERVLPSCRSHVVVLASGAECYVLSDEAAG